jgi:hypothetical protein
VEPDIGRFPLGEFFRNSHANVESLADPVLPNLSYLKLSLLRMKKGLLGAVPIALSLLTLKQDTAAQE